MVKLSLLGTWERIGLDSNRSLWKLTGTTSVGLETARYAPVKGLGLGFMGAYGR
jgi:hypothetical protein